MRRVLLIASSGMLLSKTLGVFRKQEKVDLSVLVMSPEQGKKLPKNGINKVIFAPGGRGFRWRGLIPYYFQYNHLRFDDVVCLYNNKDGNGYLNVDMYAWLTRTNKRHAINYDKNWIHLTPRLLARKWLWHTTGFVWLFINGLLSALVLALIWFILLLSDLISPPSQEKSLKAS